MEAFIETLMSKMTLAEKLGQTNMAFIGRDITGPILSQNVDEKIRQGLIGAIINTYTVEDVRRIQQLCIDESRLKIPLLFSYDVIHGHRTIFPIALGLSATWDLKLIEQSARIAAEEATADGLNWVFSPMVDIARDPRWGRISEGSGEDPWLGSQIAAAMVRGYQADDLSRTDTILACVKHFALYGAAEGGRDYNSVDMSPLHMYQYYLPPYQAAVNAGVGSVMTAFNGINGIPATGNRWLLNDVLREQWKFEGLIVSDYAAIKEMSVHGVGDLQEVCIQALTAGVDMDMVDEGYLETLKKSLDEKKITEQQIDQACRRILEAKYKLGLFNDPFHYCNEKRAQTMIFTENNRSIAKEIACRSFVLLKNDRQILPLAKSKLKLGLIGPLADDQKHVLGGWSAAGDWKQCVSVRQGIQNLLQDQIEVFYAKGSNLIEDPLILQQLNAFSNDISLDNRSADIMIEEAVQIAQKSDVIIAVVGEAQSMSTEGGCRVDIGLPECQKRLLKALFETQKPVILVLMNGRPLTLPWEHEHAQAILETWFAGTETGNAVAEVLFGFYNPSGKLTSTFPRHVGQIPLYYNHKRTGRPFDPNRFIDRFKVNRIRTHFN